MKNLIRKIKVMGRRKLKLMLSLNFTPKQFAWACAWGMFIGMTPFVGLQMYMAVVCSSFFGLPVYPIIVGTYITNVFTIPFIFTVCTKFGIWLLNLDIAVNFDWSNITFESLWNTGKALVLPLFVGTFVIGFILSIITFYIAYFFALWYQKKRALISAHKLIEEEKQNLTNK